MNKFSKLDHLLGRIRKITSVKTLVYSKNGSTETFRRLLWANNRLLINLSTSPQNHEFVFILEQRAVTDLTIEKNNWSIICSQTNALKFILFATTVLFVCMHCGRCGCLNKQLRKYKTKVFHSKISLLYKSGGKKNIKSRLQICNKTKPALIDNIVEIY